MWTLSIDASYASIDPHCLTVGLTEVSFPAPHPTSVKNPEKIYVQALLSNTGNIVISLTGVTADGLNGGFILPPGSNAILKCSRDEILKAIASAANQKLSVIYMSNPT